MSENEKNMEEIDLDDQVIELEDEEGNIVKFSWVATFDYKDNTYVVFEPAEETEDFETGEAVIFILDSDEEGNDLFLPVETEEELNEVFEEFIRISEEEDCDCDGDCCGHEHHEHGSCDCNHGEGCAHSEKKNKK